LHLSQLAVDRVMWSSGGIVRLLRLFFVVCRSLGLNLTQIAANGKMKWLFGLDQSRKQNEPQRQPALRS